MRKAGTILLALIIALSQISCRVPDVVRTLPTASNTTTNHTWVEGRHNPTLSPDMVPASNATSPTGTGKEIPVNQVIVSPTPVINNPVSDVVTPEKNNPVITNSNGNIPRREDTAENRTLTLVAIPDTQAYSESFPDTYKIVTAWIYDNWDKEGFDFIVHLGDIVNKPEIEKQWQNASDAMTLLNNCPYTVLPGNHDFSLTYNKETPYDYSLFNKYFPTNIIFRYPQFPNKGTFPANTMINNYIEVNGYLIISIGYFYHLSNSLTQWLGETISNNSKLPTIIVTHDFITGSGELSTGGKELWEVLKNYPNIFLIINGHAVDPITHSKQENVNTLIGNFGNRVHAIVSNYQDYKGGGGGFFRIYRIKQDLIEARTYSPLYGNMMGNSSQFVLAR